MPYNLHVSQDYMQMQQRPRLNSCKQICVNASSDF